MVIGTSQQRNLKMVSSKYLARLVYPRVALLGVLVNSVLNLQYVSFRGERVSIDDSDHNGIGSDTM